MSAAEQIKSLIPLLTFFLGMLVVGGPWLIFTVHKTLGPLGLGLPKKSDRDEASQQRYQLLAEVAGLQEIREGQETEIYKMVVRTANAENQLADALNQRDELVNLLREASATIKACGVLCDAVPTRLQNHEDDTLAGIGRIVNDQGLYHLVRDTEAKMLGAIEGGLSGAAETRRKDAERYRWLRGQGFTTPAVMWVTTVKGGYPIVHSDLDEAIDVAICNADDLPSHLSSISGK